MNYFPFHIGDYASHTAHLEPMEDLAYRRLLDVYYVREGPIPIDIQATAKLVRMRTMAKVVESVLKEFFVLTDRGWVHERCEAEIDSMRVKQAAQEEKDKHETDRMRRYRERRSAMFDALRSVEIVPAWDVPMKELQRLFDTHCNANGNAPATHLQREQVVSAVSPATAISTNTNTNTNTNRVKERERATRLPADLKLPEDWSHFCQTERPDLDPLKTFDKFRDYWTAKAGKDGAKLDWLATWRNWVREERQQAKQPANKQTAIEQRNKAVVDSWLKKQEVSNANV